MNRKETIEAIKVMQAFVDGKDVKPDNQEKYYNCRDNTLSWAWDNFNYHVKPEPRECYVAFSDNGKTLGVLTTNDNASSQPKLFSYVKMREIIE